MRRRFLSWSGYFLLSVGCQAFLGCSAPSWHFGVGGKYNEGKQEVTRPRGGDLDKAIADLESVAAQNPTYRDTLTLLGRAYYKKGRYKDAILILKRALAVNKDDEIAWITLGLAQLHLGEDASGMKTLKGGLTLFSKASKDGYRGLDYWDKNGAVRSALRRAVFAVTKGEKPTIIRDTDLLLVRIDQEEWDGNRDNFRESVINKD
jgi:tetratricopeptide (TPR) repeat protein